MTRTPLRPVLLLLLVGGLSNTVFGAAAPPGGQQPPLLSHALVVQPRVWRSTVPATGTLVPNDEVRLLSELALRLTTIHVPDGALVKRGDTLYSLDDRDLRARIKSLTTRKKLAETREKRLRNLRERQAVPQDQYDEAANELEYLQSQIEELSVQLAKTVIGAPFDGSLSVHRVSQGALLTPTTELNTLYDVRTLKLELTLPERYAPVLRVGQYVTFRVEGLAQDFNATVDVVYPALDQATRTVRLQARVDNSAGLLKPGMFARAQFSLEESSTALVVPSYALLPTARGQQLFVAKDGKAELRSVELGSRTSEEVVVTRGLEPGETVLISNVLRLRPGSAVQVLTDLSSWQPPLITK